VKHLSSKNIDEAAKFLKGLGIVQKAKDSGAVDLADTVEAILKAPFRETVPVSSQIGQHIWTTSYCNSDTIAWTQLSQTSTSVCSDQTSPTLLSSIANIDCLDDSLENWSDRTAIEDLGLPRIDLGDTSMGLDVESDPSSLPSTVMGRILSKEGPEAMRAFGLYTFVEE
jgi:hypothetical protein